MDHSGLRAACCSRAPCTSVSRGSRPEARRASCANRDGIDGRYSHRTRLDVSAEYGTRLCGVMQLVALLATARRNGNNNRLSILWREVISLAGVARSISKASSYRSVLVRKLIPGTRCELEKTRRLDMRSNGVIETVAPFWRGIRKVPYSRMRLPFSRALRVFWWNEARMFHAAGRHLSSLRATSPVRWEDQDPCD